MFWSSVVGWIPPSDPKARFYFRFFPRAKPTDNAAISIASVPER
jgi:hypothetical protein